MSIPEFNDLFHDSGAQGLMDLLLSKLEGNDLSPDEALAMLSAVHEELGRGSNPRPEVYQSYASFMKELQRINPEIYDHVTSSWKRRNEKGSSNAAGQDENIGDIDTIEQKSQDINAGPKEGFVGDKVIGGESDGEEEPQEPGETDEEENIEVEKTDGGGRDLNEQGTEDEADEDTEGEDDNREEEKDVEVEESNDDEINDREENLETGETHDENTQEGEEEAELGENESESDGEEVRDEVDNESTTETEKGEPAEEAGGEQAETEWPEIGETDAEEPLEGFEAEEDPSSGED